MSSSKEAYNDVEISAEDISALNGEQTTVSENTPKEETSEVSQTKEATNPEGSDSDYVYDVNIDGKSYSVDDIAKWKADSENKDNWSKSNTEKAQKIAGVGKFLKQFNEDEKLQEHLKSYYEDVKDFDSLGLKGNDVVEPTPTPEISNELDDRLNKLEEAEYSRVVEQRTSNLDKELTVLEGQYPDVLGTPEQVMDFLNFADKNSARYRDSKGIVDISHMFKEYSFDHMRKELSHFKKLNDNGNRNSSVVDRSEVGAVETVTPTNYKSWKDIDPKNPDLKKYFDE